MKTAEFTIASGSSRATNEERHKQPTIVHTNRPSRTMKRWRDRCVEIDAWARRASASNGFADIG